MKHDDNMAIVADLGSDMLWMIHKACTTDPVGIPVTPGAGPRHFLWHPTEDLLYVLNELNNTVTLYALNHGQDSQIPLLAIDHYSTLPENVATSSCLSADLHFSADNAYLYCSVRGCDTIAVYNVEINTGKLSSKAHISTHGKCPRNFAIMDKWMFVANQDSSNIVVFEINAENGIPEFVSETSCLSPVCIEFKI